MVHDYSRRYSQVLQKRQPVRQNGGKPFWLSRVIGTVMLAVAVAGIGFSLWVSHRITVGLAELAVATSRGETLAARRDLLAARRDSLQDEPAVHKRAAELGLFVPTADQIRRL